MTLKESLQQPFPYNPSIKGNLVLAVFFGLFILVFLLVFKPFDLDQFTSERLFWIAVIYGGITFSCVFIPTALAPLLFPRDFTEAKWTTGKQIVFTTCVIFLVGVVNFFVSPVLVDTPVNLKTAIWFQGITLAIGLLPVGIYFLVRQNQLLKKFSMAAAEIEEKLHARIGKPLTDVSSEPSASAPVVFTGGYQNERVELNIDNLHVITSASNYIKLYHKQKNGLTYSILRCTLKKAEEVIQPYSNFFKCHRAFIVNLDRVEHVEGNAQGYKLRIEGYEELIPVSRNLSTEFSDKLLAFRGQ